MNAMMAGMEVWVTFIDESRVHFEDADGWMKVDADARDPDDPDDTDYIVLVRGGVETERLNQEIAWGVEVEGEEP